MKLKLTALFTFFLLTVAGQDISGSWQGALKIQAIQLRVVINITKSDEGFTSTLDSPDQGAKGIPVTTTTFTNNTLNFAVTNLRAEYEGVLKGDTISGTFKQMGQAFPLKLARGKVVLVRPQEPIKPYPYYEEEVIFENKSANCKLAGTLTLPKKEGLFPVVILISGSGPQNRNEELLGHQPFLVLSDYLTRNDIAVLRYDDRSVGGSTGDFKTATSFDFSTDVEAGIVYLMTRKEINKKQIGLVGHSEGGLIAPMVAARSGNVAFIVLLAAPGVPGDQVLLEQQKLIGKAMGVDEGKLAQSEVVSKGAFDIVKKSKDMLQMKIDLTAYLKKNEATEVQIKSSVEQMNPWMRYFLSFDPVVYLTKVKCPVLALNGEKDLQVPPQQNLEGIKNSFAKGKNKNVTTKVLPGLNHLFQECKTGAPSEYATIEQTFSPIALTEILTWISAQTK